MGSSGLLIAASTVIAARLSHQLHQRSFSAETLICLGAWTSLAGAAAFTACVAAGLFTLNACLIFTRHRSSGRLYRHRAYYSQ